MDLPADAVLYVCEGCDDDFPNFNRMLNHRKGNDQCKGADYHLRIPDHAGAQAAQEPVDAAEPPSPQPPFAAAAADEEPDGSDGEEPGDVERAPSAAPVGTASAPNGNGHGDVASLVLPSTTQQRARFSAMLYAAYDAFRGTFGYQGNFNDWIEECMHDYLGLLGARVVFAVDRPPVRQTEAVRNGTQE